MTTIYFVRHGRVENKEAVTYGRMPGFELSLEGREEAEKTGEFFRDKQIDFIFTSPLARCFQTAEIISKYVPDVPIKHVFDLIEVESSLWQGLPWDEILKNGDYEKFINNPNSDDVEENLNALTERVVKFTTSLLKKYPGKNLLCVSHEFPILALKLGLEKIPLQTLQSYNLDTADVLKFIFDENGKLVKTEEKKM